MIVGEHDSLMHEEYEEHEPEIGKDHQGIVSARRREIGFRGLFKPLGKPSCYARSALKLGLKLRKWGWLDRCANGSQYLPKHSDG